MKINRTLFFIFALLFTFSSLSAHAQSAGFAKEQSYFPGQLYIKFDKTSHAGQSAKILLNKLKDKSDLLQQINVRNFENILTPRLKNASQAYLLKHPQSDLRHHLTSLRRIYQLNYSGNIPAKLLAAKLSRHPDIEYAVPRYYHKLLETPNDPQLDKHLNFHKFFNAWDESTGNKDVVIGIVDSGVEYTHEDIANDIWVNQDEIPSAQRDSIDQNGDGTIYAQEIQDYLNRNNGDYNGDTRITLQDALHNNSPLTTGNDTDGNGYADDLFGWDFWQSGLATDNREQDNDPIGDNSFHGTHVGGLAGAATDNNTGIAGTGYNARIMAVKAGGIKDNPDTNPDESNIIGFGYEGMLYAALNGADIINTSWGGSAFSEMEKDILDTVVGMGILVVSAAGNDGTNSVIYPASFKHTLAVGSIETNEQIATYSNFGYRLDVLATGTNITGPVLNNNYASHTGTSMSTPIVSGLAALLKSKHPNWSGKRIGKQIRVTSRRIDINDNQGRRYLLGHGYIDAERALNTIMPGLQVLSTDFVNQNGEKLGIDESGKLQFQLVNYGATTSNISLNLLPQENNLTVSNRQQQAPTLAQGDTAIISFDIRIESDFDLAKRPSFILTMRSGQGKYNDFHHFEYTDLLFDIVAANNVYTSFASNGTIGFTNALNGSGGVGFQPRRKESGRYVIGPNLLFEGGLITSYDGSVQDAVRSTNDQLSRDFKPLSTFRLQKPGTLSDVDGQTRFSHHSDTADVPEVEYSVQTYAFDEPSLNNVVYVRYDIKNATFQNRQLRSVYAGLFNDWDLGSVVNNSSGYIREDSLLYVYDASERVPYYVAVAPMNQVSGMLAINNAQDTNQDPLKFGIYNGFTDTEKWLALTSETERTVVENTDVSTVVASGPFNIGPRASVTVGFIYAYGNSLNQLQAQVQAARQRNLFSTSEPGTYLQTDDEPESTKIYQNYPNPFNNTTNIRIDLTSKQRVSAEVYNVIGQKVATLANQSYPSGIHTLRFNGEGLSSGLYFVNIQTQSIQRTIKVNLVK